MNNTETHNSATPAVQEPSDKVKAALNQAVSMVTGANPTGLSNEIVKSLDLFLSQLIPSPPRAVPDEDKCKDPDPAIANFCATKKLALATASNTFEGSKTTSTSTLQGALNQWTLALHTYDFNVTTADVAVRAAVKAAVDTYTQKNNPDSESRSLFLYHTMQEAVATALEAFESNLASAGGTLASAAGTLLGAYITFITAIGAAQTTCQTSDATARASFWQSVESVGDQN
jgi:hypothetical protein